MYVSYDLATPLQGVYPTEMCVYIHHKKCIVFVEALLIITPNRKAPRSGMSG